MSASEPCRACAKPVFAENRFCPACGTRVVRLEQPKRAAIVREFAHEALRSAGETALDLMHRPTVRKVAGGAALGMGIAAVVPLVSLSVGAAAGAAFVGYKLLTKD